MTERNIGFWVGFFFGCPRCPGRIAEGSGRFPPWLRGFVDCPDAGRVTSRPAFLRWGSSPDTQAMNGHTPFGVYHDSEQDDGIVCRDVPTCEANVVGSLPPPVLTWAERIDRRANKNPHREA